MEASPGQSGPALGHDELTDERLEPGADPAQTGWKPQCKWFASAAGAIVVYALGLVGIDLGAVVHDVAAIVNVDPPDEQAIAVAIGALAAHYATRNDLCAR